MPSLESSNDRTMTSLTPIPATRAFQNCTIANQDRLLADLITAAVTSEGAVTGGTHVSQARSWRLFSEYLDSIGLSHDYTSIHSPGHNSTRSCALSPWLCGRRGFQDQLMKAGAGTIRGTISNVCLTFAIRESIGSGAISEACLLLCDEIKKADYEI